MMDGRNTIVIKEGGFITDSTNGRFFPYILKIKSVSLLVIELISNVFSSHNDTFSVI